jgi:hypothetical protein
MSMSGQHICYFSKKCKFSEAFLAELARTPFSREVRLVCVDPSADRPPLPAWLKIIPTLLVAGADGPLVGANAVNNWLFERKLGGGGGAEGGSSRTDPFQERNAPLKVPSYSPDVTMRPSPSSGTPSATRPSASTGPAADSADGPLAWHSNEMAGKNWSDSYSFIGSAFTAEKGVNPIIRNFELLGGGGGGLPAPSAGGSMGAKPQQQQTAKEKKLLADFEAYARNRDAEFAPARRIG